MPKAVHLDLIDRVEIASPCPMRWEDLEGDGAVRFCGKCCLHVRNLSMMTRAEAEAFLRERQGKGRTCAVFHRRADGTILTRDCPVGLRLARQRALRALGRVAAALGVLLTGAAVFGRPASSRLRVFQPFAALCERLAPAAPPPVFVPAPLRQQYLLGRVRVPQPPVTPAAPVRPAAASCEEDGAEGER